MLSFTCIGVTKLQEQHSGLKFVVLRGPADAVVQASLDLHKHLHAKAEIKLTEAKTLSVEKMTFKLKRLIDTTSPMSDIFKPMHWRWKVNSISLMY